MIMVLTRNLFDWMYLKQLTQYQISVFLLLSLFPLSMSRKGTHLVLNGNGVKEGQATIPPFTSSVLEVTQTHNIEALFASKSSGWHKISQMALCFASHLLNVCKLTQQINEQQKTCHQITCGLPLLSFDNIGPYHDR